MVWENNSKRKEELKNARNLAGEPFSKIRLRILARDNYKCQMIRGGKMCSLKATDVDHKEDRHNHEDYNLQSLCSVCHRRKTSADVKAEYKRDNCRPQKNHWGYNNVT